MTLQFTLISKGENAAYAANIITKIWTTWLNGVISTAYQSTTVTHANGNRSFMFAEFRFSTDNIYMYSSNHQEMHGKP